MIFNRLKAIIRYALGDVRVVLDKAQQQLNALELFRWDWNVVLPRPQHRIEEFEPVVLTVRRPDVEYQTAAEEQVFVSKAGRYATEVEQVPVK